MNDITPNLKIDWKLKLKTTTIWLLQTLWLAAAPCNIVHVFTKEWTC